jgi:hypothetical protein
MGIGCQNVSLKPIPARECRVLGISHAVKCFRKLALLLSFPITAAASIRKPSGIYKVVLIDTASKPSHAVTVRALQASLHGKPIYAALV